LTVCIWINAGATTDYWVNVLVNCRRD